jgi:3-phosphoshikimate 1-carboxyvinyltransferase
MSTFNSSFRPPPVVRGPASKSISNRLLIIQALSQQTGRVLRLSDSDDTAVLQQALATASGKINVGHAGTAYRFLTALFALQNTQVTLDGSDRMRERPIGILVDALRELGGEITYTGKEGFPPLQISGGGLTQSEITVAADTSSQFISALMLIGPCLPEGLTIYLEGDVVSRPYIDMTAKLMTQCGAHIQTDAQQVRIENGEYQMPTIEVETDWSGISFWYTWVLLGRIDELVIENVTRHSVQGDAYVQHIFAPFGVSSRFENGHLILNYAGTDRTSWPTHFDFTHTPDLTQPFVVAMAGMHHEVTITGVHHLQIKETNRLDALQAELAKFGVACHITENGFEVKGRMHRATEAVEVATYKDHRMAMAFAPLKALGWDISFDDAEVVTKSYPNYWQEVAVFEIEEE